MSLKDWEVSRDNFEYDDRYGDLSFPCEACIHSEKDMMDEPCRTCDHNVCSVDD